MPRLEGNTTKQHRWIFTFFPGHGDHMRVIFSSFLHPFNNQFETLGKKVLVVGARADIGLTWVGEEGGDRFMSWGVINCFEGTECFKFLQVVAHITELNAQQFCNSGWGNGIGVRATTLRMVWTLSRLLKREIFLAESIIGV